MLLCKLGGDKGMQKDFQYCKCISVLQVSHRARDLFQFHQVGTYCVPKKYPMLVLAHQLAGEMP